MEWFDKLVGAVGPVGALCAIALAYVTNRMFTLQDKVLELGMGSAQFQTNVLSALETIKDAVQDHK